MVIDEVHRPAEKCDCGLIWELVPHNNGEATKIQSLLSIDYQFHE
jgi:hypothetical protein